MLPILVVPIIYTTLGGVVGAGGLFAYIKRDDIKNFFAGKDLEDVKKEFPALLAISYAAANIDGDISNEEEKCILQIKTEAISIVKDEEFNSTIDKIQNKAKDFTLSSALEFVNDENEKDVIKQIKDYVGNVIQADSIINSSEENFLKMLEVFIKNGKRKSLDKIIELENQQNFECYYYTTQKNYKPLVENVKVIDNLDQCSFINKNEFKDNTYYMIHPMNKQFLMPFSEIANISENIVKEWQSLARKLGAKEFKCIVEEDTEMATSLKVGAKAKTSRFNIFKANVDTDFENEKKNIEKKFQQFDVSWNGSTCNSTEEKLVSELLWLKGSKDALEFINSSLSDNKIISQKFDVSFSSFSSSNSVFNFEGALHVIGSFNGDMKVSIQKDLSSSLKFKQIIEINF